jgi:hypothetical protein
MVGLHEIAFEFNALVKASDSLIVLLKGAKYYSAIGMGLWVGGLIFIMIVTLIFIASIYSFYASSNLFSL